jgi:hypothetical protein
MERSVNVETKCAFVGDFAADNELPAPPEPASPCHPQKVEYIGTFAEDWPGDLGMTDFHVLLHDNRIVNVRGYSIKYLPSQSSPSDVASYGILSRIAGQEVFVAMFRASEVTGIFSGGIEPVRASA